MYFRCRSVFFFKQKTAYEVRISDWSSDVCSSDLAAEPERGARDREQDDRRSRAHPKVRFHQGCHCRDSFLEPLPFRGGVGVGALGVAQGRWPPPAATSQQAGKSRCPPLKGRG